MRNVGQGLFPPLVVNTGEGGRPMESPYGENGFINWNVEDAVPYKINVILSDECAKFVGAICESTVSDHCG